VLCTKSVYPEVSISCCVMYTVTISGGMHLVLFDTQLLYQEVSYHDVFGLVWFIHVK